MAQGMPTNSVRPLFGNSSDPPLVPILNESRASEARGVFPQPWMTKARSVPLSPTPKLLRKPDRMSAPPAPAVGQGRLETRDIPAAWPPALHPRILKGLNVQTPFLVTDLNTVR